MSAKKKAYCYLVSNEGRDFYLLIGFIYYLEKYEGFDISFEFVWNADKIRRKRPDLVILPNIRGQLIYWQIADYCKKNSILVFHHDSEGNFNTNNDRYEYFGYNISKERYCPLQFTWNEKVKAYLEKNYPIYIDHIAVTGAPGFDKYQFLARKSRSKILKKYSKESFSKVIGYAGWAFGKIYNKELDDLLMNLKLEKESGVKWLENNRDFVESVLESAILKNTDTLFILKKHPRENFESDYRDSRNEMNRLTRYPNVLYLKDQEEIQDLISISDLWLSFESTSTMEAWLLDIPTALINQTTDFVRSEIYKGTRIIHSATELQQLIEEIDKNPHPEENSEILAERRRIIRDSIGFSDGFNHLRTAHYFRPFLEKIDTKKQHKPTFNRHFFTLYLFQEMGKFIYNKSFFERIPKLKKNIWAMENYRLDKVKALKTKVYQDLDAFYSKTQLKERIPQEDFWKNL